MSAARRLIVVVAHAWYTDVIGGSFRLATEFATDLANCGHRVFYVCCAPDSSRGLPAQETIEGVDVRRYPRPQHRTRWGRLRHHVAATADLVAEIHSRQAVDAISGHSPLQFRGAMQAVRSDGRIFRNYTVHSPFDDELMSNSPDGRVRWRDRVAARIARHIERRNLQGADLVQTDSHFTLDVLATKYGAQIRNKGTVAPGWVDTEQIRPIQDRRALRQSLGEPWNGAGPVFFTLRRLESRMGLETLIGAACRLRDGGRTFRVLIGGGGSLRSQLEQQIRDADLSDRMYLLGRLPEVDLARCYAAADCFVLPTRALECFGLIVLEAFAAGTPVIASRVAAIPEIAGQQGDNFLFEPGNADELADRMQRFLAGELRPAIDLRQTACQFERRVVTRQWRRLVRDEGGELRVES
jgi:glycosyltransferase involved in cell wall biosynthesis